MIIQAKSRKIPNWIWHGEREKQNVVILKKHFTLDEAVDHLELHLACTGEVDIALNDALIGHFPEQAHNTSSFAKAESFPVMLEPGSYTLSFRITCRRPMPIEPINIHLHDRSVGCIAFVSGRGLWLPTDATWEAGETKAEVVCVLGEEPFGELDNGPDWFVAGGYEDIKVQPITDCTILSVSGLEVEVIGGSVSVAGTAASSLVFSDVPARDEQHIFYHLLKQNDWTQLKSQQSNLNLSGIPGLLIALPMELNVRFQIVNHGTTDVVILWNGAESLEELEHYEACITESIEVRAGTAKFTKPQGMRFVRMFMGGQPGTRLHLEIRFESAGVQLEQVGRLRSDSGLMQQIHDVSVHTSLVCHQIGLWDGIKRDRLNWAYDIYMAGKTDYVLWEDLTVLKRSIRELGNTPYGCWMNALPSYTLWWLCGIWDYYWETGDRNFVLEIKDDLLKHIRWVQTNTDPVTGFFCTHARNEMSFIEWSPMRESESWFCLNAIHAMAKEQMNRLAAHMPELEIDWDEERPFIEEEVFTDGSSSLLTTLLGIMSGYVSNDHAHQFLASYRVKDPITPLSAYWLAQCCSEYGLHDRAWEVISTVWGSMLEAGATTFWESSVLSRGIDYHAAQTTYTAYDSYRMSLCHSWASTPVVWISRYVLGIKPLEPGYREFSFEPNAVGGMTSCSGVVNSPRGPISVAWSLEEGRMKRSIRICTENLADAANASVPLF